MFKTILCIPPDYDHNYPPLGTPVLSAFLKKHGFPCSQLDLNLGYRDFLAARVTGPAAMDREERLFFLDPLLRKFFRENLKGKYYSSFLPKDGDGFFPALPYGNNTNSSFYFCERLLSSEHLWRYLEDAGENTFYQFYEEIGVAGILEKEGIRLLGISLISPSQTIAGLTLGLYIKKRLPGVHVAIGGQWVTLFREAIARRRGLSRCFDSVIAFEGESALLALARSLAAGKDAAREPGREEDMDSLPCPDFDGLPLADYDAGKREISLTYETSRGCHWSKCAYCVDLPLPKPSYRRKNAAEVVKDMKELRRRYNARYLLFGDPGLSPRQMREISARMLEERVEMGWWTMARLDPGFDRGLFEMAHAAGLRQVNFGFETACDRVSVSLDKGNLRARSSRIIRDCAGAGITVDLQTMVGLPGESFEDGMDTVDFLISHKEFISHVTFNTYYLTPANHVYNNPAKYGIEYDPRPHLPFAFFIPFRNTRGMEMRRAELLEKLYHSLMRKNDRDKAGASVSPGPLEPGHVEFSLNNESCSLHYKRDRENGGLYF